MAAAEDFLATLPPPPASAPPTPSTTDVISLGFTPDAGAPSATQSAAGPAPATQSPEAFLATLPPPPPQPPQPQGRFARLWEHIHPTKTEAEGGVINPELDKLPDWTDAPEMSLTDSNPFSNHTNRALMAQLGTLISGPEETLAVLKEQFPGAKIEKKRAYIVINSEDGQRYSWKPGMRASDWTRAAKTIPVTAGGAALTTALLPEAAATAAAGLLPVLGGQALLELQKARAGGGVSLGNMVGAGLLHGLLHGTGRTTAINALADEGGGALAGAEGAAVQPPAPAAPPAPPAPPMTTEQLRAEMAAAGRGNASSAAAVAGQVNPNPEAMAAARTLKGPDGQPLIESLTPAQLSQNPRYRGLANAATGAEDTHKQTISALGGALDNAIEVAHSPANQGALETAAREEIGSRLSIAKKLASEKQREVWGRHGVGGLVPGNTPTPISKFDAFIKTMQENRLGNLPPEVEQIRNDLYRGTRWIKTAQTEAQLAAEKAAQEEYGKFLTSEHPNMTPAQRMNESARLRDVADIQVRKRFAGVRQSPTQAMVEPIRRKLQSGGYKDADRALQTELASILWDDQIETAKTIGGEVADKALDARGSWWAQSEMHRVAHSVLGEDLTKSLTDKVTAAVRDMPHGPPDEVKRILNVAPVSMRHDLVKFATRQFVDRNRNLDVVGLNDWYKAMEGNRPSWNMFKSYAGADLAEGLESTAKISRNVEAAMRAAKPRGEFPEPWDLPGLAKKAFKLLVAGHIGGPLGAAGYAIADRILEKPSPINDAVGKYLASPISCAFMTAAERGYVSPGLFQSMLRDPAFRMVMDAAQIPAHARQAWLHSAASPQQQEAQ